MSGENLTAEQKQFLEDCELEFADRYTNLDEEYKKIYDAGIPPPPIMYPWYQRSRYNNDRPGGSRGDYYRSKNKYSRYSDKRFRPE